MDLPLFIIAAVCAGIPLVMTLGNHLLFRRPRHPSSNDFMPEVAKVGIATIALMMLEGLPKKEGLKAIFFLLLLWLKDHRPTVSVLIPARDEASNIEGALRSILASEEVKLEVIVLDDHSTDGTGEIVTRIAKEDSRVILKQAPELPAGWCGKQHACYRLSEFASYDRMLFMDADVTVSPDAIARLVAFQQKQKAPLVSAFPRQITGTFLEKLMIPLIEYILLSYLPLQFARLSKSPGFAAGCGQVFLAEREAYDKVGGHQTIKHSLHDGVKLPRAFRQNGYHTDFCVGEGLFTCRMYHNAEEVWSGLSKNAHEGIGAPPSIVPFTALLLGMVISPILFCLAGFPWLAPLAWIPRALNAIRFKQSWLGVLLHPVSIILFLIIQWKSLFRLLAGKKPTWKGREVG
ncbi:MAG: glycosyltransferase family 2 protein [Verrucomicrobiota bacterium]